VRLENNNCQNNVKTISENNEYIVFEFRL